VYQPRWIPSQRQTSKRSDSTATRLTVQSWKTLVDQIRAANQNVKFYSPGVARDITWLEVCDALPFSPLKNFLLISHTRNLQTRSVQAIPGPGRAVNTHGTTLKSIPTRRMLEFSNRTSPLSMIVFSARSSSQNSLASYVILQHPGKTYEKECS